MAHSKPSFMAFGTVYNLDSGLRQNDGVGMDTELGDGRFPEAR